ncbi:hypothetical protein [Streptomyces sp. NPDC059970]|uniref:hypothetical protein n=1 Tax=Streptomyces sp. NPDC059970 TaxID=3347019 RepID=UPI0036C7742D
MPFEADLAHALDRTTDSLEPDLTTLTSGAVERGRSRSRRRRSAAVIAGVGACAAIAAAGLVLPGALAGTRSAGSGMETVALAMPRSAISGTQMIDAVKKTFPGSRFGHEDGQSNDPSNPSSGWVANGGVDVNDGHGAANVGVSALRLKLPLRDGEGLNCDAPTAIDTRCTEGARMGEERAGHGASNKGWSARPRTSGCTGSPAVQERGHSWLSTPARYGMCGVCRYRLARFAAATATTSDVAAVTHSGLTPAQASTTTMTNTMTTTSYPH